MPSTASSCANLPSIGSPSFQVPPPRSRNYGLNQLVDKLTSPLTDEESMSTTTVRGWPSSNYFIQGKFLHLLESPMNMSKTGGHFLTFAKQEGTCP
ncbi:hypothetical protein UlMin_032406 [Ulmus minor]